MDPAAGVDFCVATEAMVALGGSPLAGAVWGTVVDCGVDDGGRLVLKRL